MPLALLIPSLLRISSASLSSLPHPLHTLLEPLLLTTRSAAAKYHVELPQILSDGGGAGEMEETMMWFAVNYEKGPEQNNAHENVDEPWRDDAWRTAWLERMERRECVYLILVA